MTDVNLAVIPSMWQGDINNLGYVTQDNVVTSPSGQPTLKFSADYERETREGNCDNDWCTVYPGDHIVFKVWAKTALSTETNDWSKGAWIGVDFDAHTNLGYGIVDSVPWDYEYVDGDWHSSGGKYGTFPHAPISQFILPWNSDWTLLSWDFYIPTTYYTEVMTSTIGSLPGGWSVCNPVQIDSIAVWVGARGVTDPAFVWFGDAEWYINPSDPFVEQVQTPSFNPVGGVYGVAQNVTISSVTSGATLYYTDDGSTPTAASTEYTVPVEVAASKTLKALGVKASYTNSAVGSANYTINNPVTPSAAAVRAYLSMLRRR